jgi:hypothetical protein
MKKLFSLFLFFNISLVAYNQIIKGTVLDKDTKKPISFATVYFNATSVGSNTDENGNFKLDTKNIGSMPLSISALGYYSASVTEYSPNKNILVYLSPRVFQLNEVVVSTKKNGDRRKQAEIFKREFLGRTKNAKECIITNEDDIRFITSKDKDTLKAIALKPIIILNKGLGYKITYYLDKFEYNRSTFLSVLDGNAIFEEDSTSILSKQDKEKRRGETYLGSKMHFFRSLWKNNLEAAGYILRISNQNLTYNDMVRSQLSTDPSKSRKYLFIPGSNSNVLSIIWLPEYSESQIELLKSTIFFEKNGWYQGFDILWRGEMAKQQIADMLPFDYQPPEK